MTRSLTSKPPLTLILLLHYHHLWSSTTHPLVSLKSSRVDGWLSTARLGMVDHRLARGSDVFSPRFEPHANLSGWEKEKKTDWTNETSRRIRRRTWSKRIYIKETDIQLRDVISFLRLDETHVSAISRVPFADKSGRNCSLRRSDKSINCLLWLTEHNWVITRSGL